MVAEIGAAPQVLAHVHLDGVSVEDAGVFCGAACQRIEKQGLQRTSKPLMGGNIQAVF